MPSNKNNQFQSSSNTDLDFIYRLNYIKWTSLQNELATSVLLYIVCKKKKHISYLIYILPEKNLNIVKLFLKAIVWIRIKKLFPFLQR